MERSSRPYSSGPPSRASSKQLPPWEVSQVPQVPYLPPACPSLDASDKSALPRLWTLQATTASTVGPTFPSTPAGSPSSHPQASPLSRSNPWDKRGYTTHELPPTPPSPTRSLSAPGRLPVIPAYERSYTPPPELQRNVVAIPGTISSRTTRSSSPWRTRRRATSTFGRDTHPSRLQAERQVPFAHRFRSAIKDIFHKDSISHRQDYERIENRHWTE